MPDDKCTCNWCRTFGFHSEPQVIEAPAVTALRKKRRLSDLIDRADDDRKRDKGE